MYPVLGEMEPKSADDNFKAFIQNIFEKKVVSSVFLTGEGFEKNWYPDSLRVLCNGRRAFIGNNLYSKGACYTSMRKCRNYDDGPIYLDENRLTQQSSASYQCVPHDTMGYQPSLPSTLIRREICWEVLLEDTSDIEIHIETLAEDELRVETVSLEGLKPRTDYSLRLRIEVMFLDEKTCHLLFKDVGFGEFFPASDFQVEKVIHLGGSNGQFNSMS